MGNYTISITGNLRGKRGIHLNEIAIGSGHCSIQDVVDVARYARKVSLSETAHERMNRARKIVEDLVQNEKVEYGITTGFGKFSNVVISKQDAMQLQENLIMSHACSVGEPFPAEVVRAMMFLKANEMAKGFSGVKPSTISTLIEMLNKNVLPVVPQQGSLGASGDLAPMAHIVLVMIGKGEAVFAGNRISGAEALDQAGITPLKLAEKEGLALINGTHAMSALGCLAVAEFDRHVKSMDIIAALTVEALRGVTDAFDHRIHAARSHPGQVVAAANLRILLEGSEYTTRQGELRIQDAYSLRCTPQVHGASRDCLGYVRKIIETEINSATDNPLIFPEDGDILSGGNFHGQPLALAMDFLGIAAAETANISERRLERLVNHQLNDLPPFLTSGQGGLNSGFMIAQYTAAALVSENKVLAHPASVDSIPSSANQEDHVSMGTIAARKARTIILNALRVLGIEYLAAAQAISLRNHPGKLGNGTAPAYELIRKTIPPLENDRVMYTDMDAAAGMILDGSLLTAVLQNVPDLA
jgi:histidine ammonia-lyase